jgi:hypothetical protein
MLINIIFLNYRIFVYYRISVDLINKINKIKLALFYNEFSNLKRYTIKTNHFNNFIDSAKMDLCK